MKMHRTARTICGISMFLIVMPSVCCLEAADEAEPPKIANNKKDSAEMILIPGGSFLMGTAAEEVDSQFSDTGLPNDWKKHTEDERPRHKQTLKPFYIYKYEVTNAQYKAFIDATGHRTPKHWNGTDFPTDKRKHPVVEVSWDDALAYCQWAGTRLPKEAEWEYAARGPASEDGKPSRVFPWGNEWDRRLSNNASLHAGKELVNGPDWKAWYEGDHKRKFPLTTPVGLFPQAVSPFGVHDMAGNAWEWCEELQVPYGKPKNKDEANKTMRSRRGGSWANVALHIRSADRQSATQTDLNIYTGFRCAKNP